MRLLILFTSTLLFIAINANATHLVGGEMTYEYLGDDEYQITLIAYRDCSPDNVGEVVNEGLTFTSYSISNNVRLK